MIPVRLRDFPRLIEVQRDAARRRPLFQSPDLTYLFWESTLRCNLRCVHCGSNCEGSTPLQELTTGEVTRILDTIADDFDATRIFVSITGGEPLLRPDVYEVAGRMNDLGMRACVVTNGTLLGESEASRLVQTGMRTVSISVDGLEAEHEAMRGKGTWRKALEGIAAARRGGFQVIEAITCVRPANLGSLAAIERAVRDAGAGMWRLITIDRMGRLARGSGADTWLGPAHLTQLLDFIEKRRRELQQTGDSFSVQFSCGGFLGLDRELVVRPGDAQCFAGLCVGSILCDGMVSACPSLPRSWAQGSARTERFSSIWHGKFRAFRDLQWRRSGPCQRCSWFDVCLGGGAARAIGAARIVLLAGSSGPLSPTE